MTNWQDFSNWFWLISWPSILHLVKVPAIKIIPIHFLQLPLYFSYSSAKWTSWGYRTVFYFWTRVGKSSKCQRWHFEKVKTSRNVDNAGKPIQEYSKMIKKFKNHETKQKEVNKMKKRMFYWILAVKKNFEAEKFYKNGKEKLLEKSSKNISLETTANMPVTSVPTNNELLTQS